MLSTSSRIVYAFAWITLVTGVLLLALSLAGCTATSELTRAVISCPQRSVTEMLTHCAALVHSERMDIARFDTLRGELYAHYEEDQPMLERKLSRTWIFKVDRDTITCRAAEFHTSTNGFGRERGYSSNDNSRDVLDDHAPDYAVWYWNVRRGLESLCGTTMHIVPAPAL